MQLTRPTKKTVIGHLRNCAFRINMGATEKENIQRSLSVIKFRLMTEFRNEIYVPKPFGSFSRGTMLPRRIDGKSDVDLMVTFKKYDAKPQTYLNRLRRFADKYYATSVVKQSNPTIVLSLNHINFELVPAVSMFWGLQIPAPASDYEDWQTTDPDEVKTKLEKIKKSKGVSIVHTIKLLKYWNAINGYVFSPFELEQKLLDNWYLFSKDLKSLVYEGFENLELPWFDVAQWRQNALAKAQRSVMEIQDHEMFNEHDSATKKARELFPVFW